MSTERQLCDLEHRVYQAKVIHRRVERDAPKGDGHATAVEVLEEQADKAIRTGRRAGAAADIRRIELTVSAYADGVNGLKLALRLARH
ncbi:MAG: hypothetical protein JWQ81_6509 [Amycolatopsis sp.]|jgi:hypothetical protein|uniref:hypothetical protein n=1 Tax=Amycolatopsis sp. TaxID=37632 RepID=UPI00260FA79A|nr:hypothetical protein [Amycolatopsis sp.]MCU1685770.1 hypothetical protein [Amycolatopsis sp.]